MVNSFSIQPLSEECILVVYGNTIDISVNHHCHAAALQIRQQNLVFVKDIVPAYASLAIQYDCVMAAAYFKTRDPAKAFTGYLYNLLMHSNKKALLPARKIRIPVCYELGLDNAKIASAKKITEAALVEIHTQQTYQVFMLGFLPGFAYMGMVDEKIAMPRQSAPRKKIEPGSVGIAGKQTGIYPLASPGGWNIIGRTPLDMFHPDNNNICLLQPGDEIEFYPISLQEFKNKQHGH